MRDLKACFLSSAGQQPSPRWDGHLPDKGIRPLGQVLCVLIRVESRVSNIHMILSKVLRGAARSMKMFLFENAWDLKSWDKIHPHVDHCKVSRRDVVAV